MNQFADEHWKFCIGVGLITNTTMNAPESFRTQGKDLVSMPSDETAEFPSQTSLKTGFKNVHPATVSVHPLEMSLRQHDERALSMRMNMIRSNQGLFAPLQMRMELNTSEKGARRLPCLQSSHIARDTLLGNDVLLSPKDIFNDPSQSEVMGDPHIMAEHQLGLKFL